MEYSIGEVAKMLKVSTQTLRNWERQGFIKTPDRRPTNFREYTDADIEAIKKYLTRKD